jgi:hypothetical protein
VGKVVTGCVSTLTEFVVDEARYASATSREAKIVHCGSIIDTTVLRMPVRIGLFSAPDKPDDVELFAVGDGACWNVVRLFGLVVALPVKVWNLWLIVFRLAAGALRERRQTTDCTQPKASPTFTVGPLTCSISHS